MSEAAALRDPAPRRLAALALGLALACGLFLTWGARGPWDFVLTLRGEKLLALLTVGAAIAAATQVFQTACGNRILTPAIMGFDALYILLQTGLVFALGGVGYAALDPLAKFAAETALLTGAGVALFGALLRREARDLVRLILAGIVMGVLFRSLASFLQRLVDPAEFSVVQAASVARFNVVNGELLWLALPLCLLCLAGAWRMRHDLDVLALGRETAIGLGLDHARVLRRALALTAALVAVSTALAGPATFFGLLVASLAREATGGHRHAHLLPAGALIAGLVLVGGQALFERALGLAGALPMVVEFLGGATFLFLLMARGAR